MTTFAALGDSITLGIGDRRAHDGTGLTDVPGLSARAHSGSGPPDQGPGLARTLTGPGRARGWMRSRMPGKLTGR
jgi:hypothetical protein